jgi:hypothetical protein
VRGARHTTPLRSSKCTYSVSRNGGNDTGCTGHRAERVSEESTTLRAQVHPGGSGAGLGGGWAWAEASAQGERAKTMDDAPKVQQPRRRERERAARDREAGGSWRVGEDRKREWEREITTHLCLWHDAIYIRRAALFFFSLFTAAFCARSRARYLSSVTIGFFAVVGAGECKQAQELKRVVSLCRRWAGLLSLVSRVSCVVCCVLSCNAVVSGERPPSPTVTVTDECPSRVCACGESCAPYSYSVPPWRPPRGCSTWHCRPQAAGTRAALSTVHSGHSLS